MQRISNPPARETKFSPLGGQANSDGIKFDKCGEFWQITN